MAGDFEDVLVFEADIKAYREGGLKAIYQNPLAAQKAHTPVAEPTRESVGVDSQKAAVQRLFPTPIY